MIDTKNICVIGTGYVGLVTGTCLADSGNTVYCIDKDQEKIKNLRKGINPIYEPGLEPMIKRNLKKGNLIFEKELDKCLDKCTIIFIAVGTPQGEDGSADLQHVLAVADEIGKKMKEYKIVVNKSTVPVGTAEKVREKIKSQTDIDFDVCSNPEFLKEGSAVKDFLYPDRIIVGTDKKEIENAMAKLYHPFTLKGARLVGMSIKSAELTKYAANCFLATKISFINHIANLCELSGADVRDVRRGIGSDKRIGLEFLFPGVGYGGSCFPKDVKALIKISEELGYNNELLKTVDKINAYQRTNFVNKVLNYFNNDIKGKTFAVWGLSFKPNTDDMREAPSITIINSLLKKGANIQAFDPIAMENSKYYFKDKIKYSEDMYSALDNADALLIITEWMDFRQPDFEKIKSMLKSPTIFDGRNIYEYSSVKEAGIEYVSMGADIIK